MIRFYLLKDSIWSSTHRILSFYSASPQNIFFQFFKYEIFFSFSDGKFQENKEEKTVKMMMIGSPESLLIFSSRLKKRVFTIQNKKRLMLPHGGENSTNSAWFNIDLFFRQLYLKNNEFWMPILTLIIGNSFHIPRFKWYFKTWAPFRLNIIIMTLFKKNNSVMRILRVLR